MNSKILLKLLFYSSVRRRTWRKLSGIFRYNLMGWQEAVRQLRDRYVARKHPLAGLFSAVLSEAHKGRSFDRAFAPWIPHEEQMLIRGGVEGGSLQNALMDCADLIQARSKIVGSVIGALAYPIFTLCLFFGLILIMAFGVMPELVQISNPEKWTGAAGLLYKFTSFVASPLGFVCLLLVPALTILVLVTLPTWTGKIRLYVENIPPWSIYRLLVGSSWLYTLATMLRAGIPLDTILKDMLDSGVISPWLAERVRTIRLRLRSGGSFGSVLLHLNMNFPDKELVEDLAVFATLPNFETNLYEFAKEQLDEGVTRIDKAAKILNNAAICAVGLLFIGFVVAYFSINQLITSDLGGL